MREIDYTKLKKGENYFIEKLGSGGVKWGKGKGINYLGTTKFNYKRDNTSWTMKLGLNTLKTAPYRVSNGDPLVMFEAIVPLNERKARQCVLCELTHLKPFNAGATPGIGFKFYEITEEKLNKRLRSKAMQSQLRNDEHITMDHHLAERTANQFFGYNKSKTRSKSKSPSKSKSRSKSKSHSKSKTRYGGNKCGSGVKTRKKYKHQRK